MTVVRALRLEFAGSINISCQYEYGKHDQLDYLSKNVFGGLYGCVGVRVTRGAKVTSVVRA
jgi:hypothetical protein